MRAWRAISCILLAAASGTAAAEDQFPYTAYINADDVYVRSGPGQNYYPTSKLQVGEAVEVYRHDPGGWYAIRPPEGSFSWVAARYLKMGRDGIATVTGDRVVARVGSSFSDIRDVIQVRLERGEEVEVLDTKTLDAAQGGEKWAKVAPVSGEFRWILGKYLDRTPPEPTLLSEQKGRNLLLKSEAKQAVQLAAAQEDGSPAASRDAEILDEDEDQTTGRFPSWRKAGSQGSAKQVAFSPADADEPRKLSDTSDSKLLLTPRPRTEGNTINEEEFQAELDRIDLAISQIVAEEPTVWEFGDLRTRAETALARAQTAVERGRARLVLSKIERFQEIKDRYVRVAAVQSQGQAQEAELTAAIAEVPAAPQTTVTASNDPQQRYDGVGRLTSVVSLRIGTPHYALVDQHGAVRTYVSPAPGVNLRPYLGRQVGIIGSRGFIPEFGAGHVTARHISLLDPTMVR